MFQNLKIRSSKSASNGLLYIQTPSSTETLRVGLLPVRISILNDSIFGMQTELSKHEYAVVFSLLGTLGTCTCATELGVGTPHETRFDDTSRETLSTDI